MPKLTKKLAKEFIDTLADNEEDMAEMAAFSVTCEQFGIDISQGYELMMLASDIYN